MMRRRWLVCLALVCACDAQTGTPFATKTLSPENARHQAISFSPDGSRAAWWAIADTVSGWHLWVGDSLLRNARNLGVVNYHQGLPPVWSPDGKRIAAISSDSSFADIIVVAADGGPVQWVTRTVAPEAPVQWHPDGDRLMYLVTTSDGIISTAVLSISTGTSTPTVPSDSFPVFGLWSPDGRKLAYARYAGSHVTLWVADDRGANPRQLTTEGFESVAFGTAITNHIWSPDGSAIVYESRRTGTTDIWTVSVDSGSPRRLTNDLREDITPAWSPDGKWVVFVSDRGKQTDLWAVPAHGGTEVRITNTREMEELPYWRPRSNMVVYTTTQTRRSIWSYSLTDSTERRITPDSIVTPFFNVSPAGGKINYVVAKGGNVNDLIVADLDGSNARTLVSGVGSIVTPYWSRDGSRITFTSDRAGSQDIWVVDVATGSLRQLTNWPGFEMMATWSRDGSGVYFLSDHDTRQGDVWLVSANGGVPTRITRLGGVGIIGNAPPGDCRSDCTELFVGVISVQKEVGISRLLSDGTIRSIPGAESALLLAATVDGSLAAVPVAAPGGVTTRLLTLKRPAPPQTVLAAGDTPGMFSYDGKLLSFQTFVGGTADIGVWDIASATPRRITRTPDDESGIEFTPDNRFLIFSRGRTVQRFFAATIR